MLSSKRLLSVFRVSAITLIVLGTYSYVQAQAQHNTAPQNQAANQRSGGGFFNRVGDLFRGDDPPKTTNNVAPANAPPPVQQQPIPQQLGTPVTPPPPATRTGHPQAFAGAAMGANPIQPQQNQVAQASPANPSASNRTPLTQTANATRSGIPENQMQRMLDMHERMPDLSINPPNAGGNSPRAISVGGPPSPPPIPGGETVDPLQTTSTRENTSQRSITTESPNNRATGSPRNSISTAPKVDVTPEPPLRRVTPDDSPKTSDNAEVRPISEPPPKEAAPRIASVPEPSVSPSPRPIPIPRNDEPKPVANSGGLMTRQSPVLSFAIQGPEAMIVGKEETYKFIATNNSSVPAEGVVLNIEMPRWVQNTTKTPELSTGSTRHLPLNEEYGLYQWDIGQIAPNSSATLTLHLVTREKRPFEWKWNFEIKQTATPTKIDVQQPVIRLEFEGPNEVLWGSEENYRLKIRNTGNGDADNLMLTFSASGVNKGEAPIDFLRVGDERILDVAVQTLEPEMNELQIKIQVTGPYGLSEETSKVVVIKRAVLELDIDAPGMQYVGNTLDYVLIARNTGTTASLNTVIEATLPLGVKYVSSTHNGEFDAETNRVRWNVGTLPVNGQFDCMLICETKRAGECRLDAKVTEKTGLEATANALTYVEAIADVLLDIEKPQDPIQVGATTEYIFTITNRGTKAAENIEVGVYFVPSSIEPLAVEMGRARINAEHGEVVFESIPVLSAGETLKYRVKVRGLVSGNHRVKAILVCHSTETELTNQVMSRFYEDRNNRMANVQPYRGNTSSLALGNPSRDDSRGMTSPNTPAMTPGIPTAPTTRPTTNPMPSPQGSPTMPSHAINPLASSGPVTNRMQSSATADEENTIPALNIIPDLSIGQQPMTTPTTTPITTPLFGTPSARSPRATGSVPTLSPPPVIDANRASH